MRIALSASVLAVLLLAGCQEPVNHSLNAATLSDDSARVASSGHDGVGRETALPKDVLDSFRKDFPDAVISSVSPLAAATGEPIYRIVFISDYKAVSALYRADGTFIQERSSATPASR